AGADCGGRSVPNRAAGRRRAAPPERVPHRPAAQQLVRGVETHGFPAAADAAAVCGAEAGPTACPAHVTPEGAGGEGPGNLVVRAAQTGGLSASNHLERTKHGEPLGGAAVSTSRLAGGFDLPFRATR